MTTYLGQKLCLRKNVDEYYNEMEMGVYIIKKTDTYEDIAKKLGTTQL